MFERFTDHARNAVVLAQEAVRERHDVALRTEHLLMGAGRVAEGRAAALLAERGVTPEILAADLHLVRPPGLPDPDALATLGIDLDEVRRQAEEAFGPGALERTHAARGRARRRSRAGSIPFEAAAKKALELALREAIALRHRHIGTEHLLLGLLRTEEGVACRVLKARGITLAEVRAAVATPGTAAG